MAGGGLERYQGHIPIPPFLRREREVPERSIYEKAEGLLRAWHIIEGRNRSIIDFDLTDGPTESEKVLVDVILESSQRERTRIIRKYAEFLGGLDQIEQISPGERHRWQFLRAQVQASFWFARRLNGEPLNPIEYMEKTQAIKLDSEPPIPADVLEEQTRTVLDCFRQCGVDDPNEESVLRLRQENEIDPETLEFTFRQTAGDVLNRLKNFVGKPFNFPFSVKCVSKPEYFYAWADTDRETGGFVIQINTFSEESRPKFLTIGKVEELAPHEVGEHLARMDRRRELIRKGELHPFFGLTSVHGPEQIIDEGLAQTLVHFIPGAFAKLSPEGKLQVELTILRNMIYANVHVAVNREQPPSQEEIVKYIKAYMPWETEQEIRNEVEDRTTNPLLQTYRLAYGIGAYRHLMFARVLSDQGKKVFLERIFSDVYTSEQELELVRQILRDKRNQKGNGIAVLPQVDPSETVLGS